MYSCTALPCSVPRDIQVLYKFSHGKITKLNVYSEAYVWAELKITICSAVFCREATDSENSIDGLETLSMFVLFQVAEKELTNVPCP